MKFLNFNKSIFQRKQTFDAIEGYSEIKDVVIRALETDENYNLLLCGPPASSKTLFLMGILDTRKDAVLQSLMQDDDLIETKKVNTRSMKLHCFVFAACNDSSKLSPAILSRFQVIHMKEYTRDEFVKVTIEQLDVEPDR